MSSPKTDEPMMVKQIETGNKNDFGSLGIPTAETLANDFLMMRDNGGMLGDDGTIKVYQRAIRAMRAGLFNQDAQNIILYFGNDIKMTDSLQKVYDEVLTHDDQIFGAGIVAEMTSDHEEPEGGEKDEDQSTSADSAATFGIETEPGSPRLTSEIPPKSLAGELGDGPQPGGGDVDMKVRESDDGYDKLSAASPSDVYRESPTKTITVPLVVGDYIETYAPMKVDNSKMWGEVTELSGDNVHVRVHQQEPTTPLEFNMRFPKEECTKITKNTPSDADEAAEGFSPEPLSASCFGRNLDVELERAKELEDLQHLVKVKNNEVVEVKQEMNETVAKIEERYAEELAKIRASYGGVELNRARDEAVAKVLELQENMGRLQKRILELESQKQIWAEKKEHQSDDVAGLNRQVYELNAKKEALAEQVVNLIVERDQHSNSMAALVQIEVSQLGDELRDTRDELRATRDELREKNTQIVGFQDTIIQRDLEKHNLLNQLEDLGNEYATFRHNVEDQKSNVQEVEKGPIIHHVEAKPSNSRIFWDGIICLVFMLLGAFLCLFGLRSYDMLKYDHFANPIN
eukprot:464557_1